jgi:hypothetical protein
VANGENAGVTSTITIANGLSAAELIADSDISVPGRPWLLLYPWMRMAICSDHYDMVATQRRSRRRDLHVPHMLCGFDVYNALSRWDGLDVRRDTFPKPLLCLHYAREPSAGGQYHWISELAPRDVQKLLSYIFGWLTVFGWQVGLASVSYAAALQIQSLVILVYPSTNIVGWQTALMTVAIAMIAVGFNTVLVSKLPTFELVILVARESHHLGISIVQLYKS